MKVSIDVCDTENMGTEAEAVGCKVLEIREYGPNLLAIVEGPEAALLPLLNEWGYYGPEEWQRLDKPAEV